MLLKSFQVLATAYGRQISHGLAICECESSMRLRSVDPARGELSKIARWAAARRPLPEARDKGVCPGNRRTEKLMIDLAYGTLEMLQLRDMVHDYHLREMALWAKTDVDGIAFMDDWGAQNQLLISPAMWRELFKPLYRDYCDLIHAAGEYVFMHSDGHIAAIYPDLIEIGVDALNSQLFCMDIEALGRAHKGQITFWGEIDRQYLLPFGTVDEVRAGVRRVRRALDDGRGGVIAQCEWGIGVAGENVAAVFDAWLEPLD